MFELSGLFYYKILFMGELLIAEALFLGGMQRKSHFVWRIIGAVAIALVVSAVFPILTESYSAIYSSVMFLLLFFFSTLAMKFCFDDSYFNILFCCVAAYSVQHLAYELCDFLLVISNIGGFAGIYGASGGEISSTLSNPLAYVIYICVYLVVYTCSYFLFGIKIRKEQGIRLKSVAMFVLVVCIVFTDVIMNSFVISYSLGMDESGKKILSVFSTLYNMICCLLTMYIQYELLERKSVENDLDAMRYICQAERKQYENSKENIEFINMKCHDIKHQIASLSSNENVSSEYLDELKESISIYDSMIETGNKTLDIIITEKSLQCNRDKIKFSCIVDGAKLEFMRESDIYSLFGNMLDNAMEAVSELNEDERVITIKVYTSDDALVINEQNYYGKVLVLKDGLLQTTKEDKKYHGYGLRSMRYIADKYGGKMSIDLHDRIFDINIVFPSKGDCNA